MVVTNLGLVTLTIAHVQTGISSIRKKIRNINITFAKSTPFSVYFKKITIHFQIFQLIFRRQRRYLNTFIS